VPMIETAVMICGKADIFILTGTSLAVYPAAGLVNFVRCDVPKFIVDPNIPYVSQKNVVKIQEKATVGIPALVNQLLSQE
jgi:NAD-dependent deacetylase